MGYQQKAGTVSNPAKGGAFEESFLVSEATLTNDAASSAAQAAISASAAAASYDSFDDRYLGVKTSAPTLDNDGNALLVGALYWNSTTTLMYTWTGTVWVSAVSPIVVPDSMLTLTGSSDASKMGKFEVDGFTAATTRTFTLPNADTTLVGTDVTQTLTNKTTNLANNTLTGTRAQFNTAMSDDDFVSQNGVETLTNKTLTAPQINTPTGIVKGDVGLGNVDNTSDAAKNTAVAILTNKTIDLISNTLVATSAQILAAVTDETGTGSLVFANAPTLVNPVVGTQAVNDSTTKAASTAFVNAEIANDAVLKTSATGSGVLPAGTTAQRDGAPQAGYIRFNSTLNQYEGYTGTAWSAIGGGATGAPGNNVFVENDQSVTADYTLTTNKNAMSAGPITINTGVTVTIPTGAAWTVV